MWKSQQFLWVRTFCTALTLCVLSRVGTAEENDLKTGGTSKPDFSCIDADRFYDHYVWTKQEQEHYLFCPLSKELLQRIPSASEFTVEWIKNCLPFNINQSSHITNSTYPNGTAFLTFHTLHNSDAGNYTCVVSLNRQRFHSFTMQLRIEDSRCTVAPTFLSPSGNQTYFLPVGFWMVLNCTVKLLYDQKFNWCDSNIEWSKDGHVIMNSSKYISTEETRFNHNASEKFLSSLLNISMMGESDYGIFACFIRKGSATFTLQRDYNASHVPAVLGALLVLFALLLAGLLYVKCRLDLQLWYRNKYGEFEMNDGKLYDAYISYVSADDDRKFVNFILKPHLENKYGYKLHLDDCDILPGSEPSAELIMNISRCRRLIVVLSKSYLEQDWCRLNFREALWQLLDLSRRPIFIMFESQYRELSHPAIQLLKSQRKSFTLLLWTSTSMTPSSEFWKQLRLLLPRKISHRSVMADPQTRLQDDKDPMLILNPDYLDCRCDPDPEGDLGVRAPIYKGPPPPVFALPKMKTNPSVEPPSEYAERNDVDIADLGSRNYGTRTDFYCLVTEDDI
ncbi:single Ig IL-1-related receptor [Hemiscyllium ocellatum]|uniref:single Ig IL-1-related receptor n=1 Tax=Hemiscyllium ocellatum TaxID=170820 RepID=UPI002965E2AB|nr:single Ig IL-1-related receptor [Hemiscyllium ocellatum]